MILEDLGGDPTFSPQPDTGIPGVFVFFFVLVVAIGIGTAIWRISTARDLARRAGMDPDEATAMTLLSENGLEATYLASHLRPDHSAPPVAPMRTTAERLAELTALRDAGAITEAEYADRRRTIIDSV